MSKFQEYMAQMASLASPTPLPEGMAVLYAVSLDLPIEYVRTDGESLSIGFSAGYITIRDDGQSCCETRYMTTDDDLPSFVGAKLLGYDIVQVDCGDTEYGDCHDQMFVKVETTKGTITLVTHNEHNGYYGGFAVNASWADK